MRGCRPYTVFLLVRLFRLICSHSVTERRLVRQASKNTRFLLFLVRVEETNPGGVTMLSFTVFTNVQLRC